ncbi:MAG TPA: thermosome subunit alpha [Halobacteriales archaeon]|nr:thermosome subunit alpha [Halobacteriales archaeon]
MSRHIETPHTVVTGGDDQRTSGRDARTMNIQAGKAVAEGIRSTLGPMGMDKMLVDPNGYVVVTNDGLSILWEMNLSHPVADMLIEVAETQDETVGDGTTTAVLVAGALLAEAESLLEQGVHATTIAGGYKRAVDHAVEVLEELSVGVDATDTGRLVDVARTAMTGKGAQSGMADLAALVVDAVQAVDDGRTIDLDLVSLEPVVGGRVAESWLFEGVIVDKEPVDANMPYGVEDASVVVYGGALTVQEADVDSEVTLSTPDQVRDLVETEQAQLREQVRALTGVGADVLFVDGDVDDFAQHLLADAEILAVRQVGGDDQRAVARSTGAAIVSSLSNLDEDAVGAADSVVQKNLGGDPMLFVENGSDSEAVTVLVRGGTEHVTDEVERTLEDALGAVRTTIETRRVLPGGGASEVAIAASLRRRADSVAGREQLAIEAFADAMETIPVALAENAGLSSIDTVVELRREHDSGDAACGLDVTTGEIRDMLEQHVVEPVESKRQAIEAAAEVAVEILRIDDVIVADQAADGADDLPGGQA